MRTLPQIRRLYFWVGMPRAFVFQPKVNCVFQWDTSSQSTAGSDRIRAIGKQAKTPPHPLTHRQTDRASGVILGHTKANGRRQTERLMRPAQNAILTSNTNLTAGKSG